MFNQLPSAGVIDVFAAVGWAFDRHRRLGTGPKSENLNYRAERIRQGAALALPIRDTAGSIVDDDS